MISPGSPAGTLPAPAEVPGAEPEAELSGAPVVSAAGAVESTVVSDEALAAPAAASSVHAARGGDNRSDAHGRNPPEGEDQQTLASEQLGGASARCHYISSEPAVVGVADAGRDDDALQHGERRLDGEDEER